MNNASIIFDLDGQRYTYDGSFPDVLNDRIASLFDESGFWRGRPDLSAQCKDLGDTLPDVLWEISQLGGKVVEINGTRANGAIHLEDWENPQIF